MYFSVNELTAVWFGAQESHSQMVITTNNQNIDATRIHSKTLFMSFCPTMYDELGASVNFEIFTLQQQQQ
jgi:hypothetical protein